MNKNWLCTMIDIFVELLYSELNPGKNNKLYRKFLHQQQATIAFIQLPTLMTSSDDKVGVVVRIVEKITILFQKNINKKKKEQQFGGRKKRYSKVLVT